MSEKPKFEIFLVAIPGLEATLCDKEYFKFLRFTHGIRIAELQPCVSPIRARPQIPAGQCASCQEVVSLKRALSKPAVHS